MSLETFFKLFPRAAITLNGNVVAASIGGTNNSTYGNKVIGHIDHYNGAEDKALDAARKKIIDKILESDLDDTVKVKIMRLLNK